jgi:chromosome segregation ATPase
MSLKKQLRDQKQELLKKDEDLENMKKNIKTTAKTEIEVELKTYKEELSRMRQLLEDLLKEGPKHPMYQKQAMDRIQMLEQTR